MNIVIQKSNKAKYFKNIFLGCYTPDCLLIIVYLLMVMMIAFVG
jgi:hypothetical protein